MIKEKSLKPAADKKVQPEQHPATLPESHGILAKHRIKILKNAGISKTKDHKKTITVVNPTSEL